MTVAAAQQPPPPPREALPPELVRLAAVVGLGSIMMQLDMTMTNVATKTLLDEFAVPLATIQWVSTGYLLSMALVIPVSGWAMERFGARAVWTASLLLFLLGSVLCGVAWSADSLIGGRVVQGLGGGMIMPLAQAILAQAAGPRRLARAMAVIGVPALLGPVLGPVLGGFIVTDLSWRWIFFVNLPICVLTVLLSVRLVPSRRAEGVRRLDPVALLLLAAGSMGLVYGFAESGRGGDFGSLGALGPMVGGVLLIAAFVLRALRVRDGAPIDLSLLRERAFGSAAVVMLLASAMLLGAMGLLPLYFQQVRGESAAQTGVLMIPFGIGMGLSLIIGSRAADRVAPRNLAVTGLLLTGLGAFVLTHLSVTTGYPVLGAALAVNGAGVGGVLIPVMTASLRGLRGDQIPRASSAVRVFQQLGASFGSAVLLVVLQHRIIARSTATGGPPDAARLAEAFGDTFWCVLAIAGATLLAALFLPAARPTIEGPDGA